MEAKGICMMRCETVDLKQDINALLLKNMPKTDNVHIYVMDDDGHLKESVENFSVYEKLIEFVEPIGKCKLLILYEYWNDDAVEIELSSKDYKRGDEG